MSTENALPSRSEALALSNGKFNDFLMKTELFCKLFPSYSISPEMRKAWSDRKTMTRNLYDMGLASDANKVLNIKTSKEQRLEIVKLSNGFVETDQDDSENPKKAAPVRSQKHVIDGLETQANTFRESEFR